MLLSLMLMSIDTAAFNIVNPAGELSYLKSQWVHGRAQLKESDGGCVLGLQVEERGQRMIGIFPPADGFEFHRGDSLVAVNALALADGAAFELFVAGLDEDATATITINRNDQHLDFQLPCGDRQVWRDRFVAAMDHAIEGEFDQCLSGNR